MYEYADKQIKDMNRRNLRAFSRLKQLKFDELNILETVTKTFEDSIRLAKKRYYQIALAAYIAGIKRAKGREKDTITEDWVLDMLEEYDPVTLYQFFPEAERKKNRLIEAIIASHNKSDVIDRALRLWVLQITHYAEKSVDRATEDAYRDAGVEKVKWITAEDEKVCEVCRERNGKIYPINKIPPKPHYRCRCIVVPI